MKLISITLSFILLVSCANNTKKKNPHSGEVMLTAHANSEAVELCKDGKVEKGVDLLKKSFKKGRKNHQYWNSLAACYFYDGDFKKAEFHLNIAQEFNKGKDPYLLNNQGLILYKLGHKTDGILILEQAFSKHKSHRQILLNLAELYLQNGLYHKINENFSSLIEKNGHYSKDQDVQAIVAMAMVNLNKVDRALNIFKILNEEQQNKAEVALFYSLALSTKGNWKEASDHIATVSGKLSPFNEMIYNSLKIKIESNLRPRG